MGRLIEGIWHDEWYDTTSTGGRFVRDSAGFRNWVTPDGRAGPSGEAGFPAASGRYHLYVSLACPWAHRTLIFRQLKGLVPHIGITVCHPHMLENGWEYPEPDTVTGVRYHHELYTRAQPDYTGRCTVPVLWDRERGTIVSNESAEILRMFNAAFDELTGSTLDYYPKEWRAQIDAVNERVYRDVNNGVYRCGFATTQSAYEEAFAALFDALDWLERCLGQRRYLLGERLTEADWRLFTTLLRFDAVYHGHFKCNLQRIADYPNLSGYLRELYQVEGVAATVDFWHIKQHYYVSHRNINPTGIVPLGPRLELDAPHGREHAGRRPGRDA